MRIMTSFVLGALVAVALSSAVFAQCVDQSFTGLPTLSAGISNARAQTFTCAVAGKLTRVECSVGGGGQVTGRLHSVPPGGPMGGLTTNVLATRTATAPNGGVIVVSFDFAAENIQVVPGQVLMISVEGPGYWYARNTSGYAGGSAWFRDPGSGIANWAPMAASDDLFFRTYVQTLQLTYTQPVPGGLDIAITGGCPGDRYFTAFTTNAANANGGLGAGWWGGLHIPFDELLFLGSLDFPPYRGFLSLGGTTSYSYPAGSLSGAAGITIYANVHTFDWITGLPTNVSPPVAYTLQ